MAADRTFTIPTGVPVFQPVRQVRAPTDLPC